MLVKYLPACIWDFSPGQVLIIKSMSTSVIEAVKKQASHLSISHSLDLYSYTQFSQNVCRRQTCITWVMLSVTQPRSQAEVTCARSGRRWLPFDCHAFAYLSQCNNLWGVEVGSQRLLTNSEYFEVTDFLRRELRKCNSPIRIVRKIPRNKLVVKIDGFQSSQQEQ